MDRPQQPELYRSGTTALEPDSVESDLVAHRRPRARRAGRQWVPPDNRPGHHPEREQDQPDPGVLAPRRGTGPTKRELSREASRRRVRGRSKMTKAELARAIRRTST